MTGRTQAALAALACAVRLACIAIYGVIATLPDPLEYVALARGLAHGLGFATAAAVPTSFRPPLYPAMIAALWRGTDPPLVAAAVVQAILGAAVVALLCQITARISERAAFWAALLMALHPLSAVYTSRVMTETLLTFLIVLSAWFWMRAKPVGAGVALGLAALTHGIVLFFAVALPLLRPRWRQTLVITAVTVATIAPWSIRNLMVTGRLTPIADAGWRSNLFFGTIDVPLFSGNPWPQALREAAAETSGADPAAAEQILGQRAVERIAGAPLHWLLVRVKGYPRLFTDSGEYIDLRSSAFNNARRWVFYLMNAALLLFALAGAVLRRSELTEAPWLWAFPAFLLASHLPMWAEARRLLPAVPGLIALAALGAESILARRAKLGT